MKKFFFIFLCLLSLSFIGCTKQESYADTLKEWQAQQDDTRITALQSQVTDLNKQLDEVKKQYSQNEADKKNLQIQIDTLTSHNQQLQNELSKRPEQSDITAILNANQEVTSQYNEIARKYNSLEPMWQQLKRDYHELATALREVVASSNISANITQEYLNLIKPIN